MKNTVDFVHKANPFVVITLDKASNIASWNDPDESGKIQLHYPPEQVAELVENGTWIELDKNQLV